MAATLGRDIGVIPWDTFLTQDWVPTEAGPCKKLINPLGSSRWQAARDQLGHCIASLFQLEQSLAC